VRPASLRRAGLRHGEQRRREHGRQRAAHALSGRARHAAQVRRDLQAPSPRTRSDGRCELRSTCGRGRPPLNARALTGALPSLRTAGRRTPARSEAEPGELALLRETQAGSRVALERLFRRYWPLAYRTAYLIAQDAAAAEDIAQESFLAALRALDRFDRRRPFGPWIARIAANRAIDWTRARTLRREIPGDDALCAAGSATDPQAVYSDDVVTALARLSGDHRAVIVLRHLLGFTPGEIAAITGLPRGTVNSRLRRGLDGLAQQLDREALR
jgi:RNA polymerase sigma-70 factor (ECF subfamily)